MGKLERRYLAHYIDSNMGQNSTNYVRLGKDLEEYSEELNPQVSIARDIKGNPVVSFVGYEVQSSVESFYAEKGDPLFGVLSGIANERLNDDSCLTTKVDYLVDESGNQIWAYREDCLIVPVSVGGDTSGVQIPFNIYGMGNRVSGSFNATTKQFTADT